MVGQVNTGLMHIDGSGADLPLTTGVVDVSLVDDPVGIGLGAVEGKVLWSIDSGGARTLTPPNFTLHHGSGGEDAFLEANLKGGAALTASNTFTLIAANPGDSDEGLKVALDPGGDDTGGDEGFLDSALLDLSRGGGENNMALATLAASADEGDAAVGGGAVVVGPSEVGYIDVARGGFTGNEIDVELTFEGGQDETALASWINDELNWGNAANTVAASGDDQANTILLTGLPMEPGPESFFSWEFAPFNVENGTNFQVTGVAAIATVAAGVPGDFNGDGVVNTADYTVLRNNLGAPAGTLPNDPTGVPIGQQQYDLWAANFGSSGGSAASAAVPEPATWTFMLMGIMTSLIRGSRRNISQR